MLTEIYTDGACSGNGKPDAKGGWGLVAYFVDGGVHEMGGSDFAPGVTSNRMELKAAIAALELFAAFGTPSRPQIIKTDSEYVQKNAMFNVVKWKQNGWMTKAGTPVVNRDLWEQLDALMTAQIRFVLIPGHSGIEGNERADVIAKSFKDNAPASLKQRICDAGMTLLVEGPPVFRIEDFSLNHAVAHLCRSIRDYRDETWDPSEIQLTDAEVRSMAAWLIYDRIFDRQGQPIDFDGADIGLIWDNLFGESEQAA